MMVFPFQVGSAFATSRCDSKRTAKKTMSALTASASFLGMIVGPIGRRGGCKAFRVARGCHGHFDAIAGKRLGQGLADLAEADNCVAHIFSLGLPSPTALRIIEWSAW